MFSTSGGERRAVVGDFSRSAIHRSSEVGVPAVERLRQVAGQRIQLGFAGSPGSPSGGSASVADPGHALGADHGRVPEIQLRVVHHVPACRGRAAAGSAPPRSSMCSLCSMAWVLDETAKPDRPMGHFSPPLVAGRSRWK